MNQVVEVQQKRHVAFGSSRGDLNAMKGQIHKKEDILVSTKLPPISGHPAGTEVGPWERDWTHWAGVSSTQHDKGGQNWPLIAIRGLNILIWGLADKR